MLNNKVITEVKFVKCHEKAKTPAQSKFDIGFDLSSVDWVELEPFSVTPVDTGIKLVKPVYHPSRRTSPYFQILGRSGLASQGILPVGGCLDLSYTGEIKVLLYNTTNKVYYICPGDRVAQMVCFLVMANTDEHEMKFIEVTEEEIQKTERGQKGFGASGR